MPSQPSKPDRRSRGPRDDRGVTLNAITTAARVSFAENGWAGTTMRAVAKSAGVDAALVHYYFDSKEQLLDASTTPPAEWVAKLQEIPTVPLRGHCRGHGAACSSRRKPADPNREAAEA